MTAPIPENEAERLAALHQYQILDTLPEQAFDDITLLASQICGTPIAAVSLVDESRQWFKSRVGLEESETSRDDAFCAHTILETDLMIVPDAQADPRFVENPLVTGDLHLRFYAGAPLLTPDGQAVGALCVIDRVPRVLTAQQQDALRALGRQVASQLELKYAHAKLQETAARFQAAVESMQEGLVLQDAAGVIQVCNATAERLIGQPRKRILGKEPAELGVTLLREDETPLPAAEYPHVQVLRTGIPQRDVLLGMRAPDSEIVWRSLSCTPLFHPNEERPYGVVVTFSDVTEKKRLDNARALLTAIVDASDDAITATTLDGKIASWSVGAERMYGYTNAEIVGQPASVLAGTEDPLPLPAIVQALQRGERVAPRDVKRRRKDGTSFDVRLTFSAVQGTDGKMVRLAVIGHDITAQIQAEAEVRRSEAQLAAAQRIAHIGSWEYEIETKTLTWSEEMFRLMNFDPRRGTPKYEDLAAHYYPEDTVRLEALIQKAVHDGLPYEFDLRILGPDGRYRWTHAIGEGVRDAAGNVTHLFGTLRDIHAQKAAEEAQARMTGIIEATSDFIGIANPEGNVVYENAALRALLGHDEHATYHASEAHMPETVSHFLQEAIPTAIRTGLWQGEAQFRSAKGRSVPVSQVILAHRDDTGQTQYLATIARDISVQKAAEAALEKNRASLLEAQRLAHLGSWEFDTRTGKVTWSDEMFPIYGRDPADGVPNSEEITRFYHPDDLPQRLADTDRAMNQGIPFEADRRIVRPDGEIRAVHTIGKPLFDSEGQVIGLFGTVVDVTERTRNEEAIRRAEQQVRDYSIVLEAKMQELEAVNAELESLATTDGLTSLTNHRAFQDKLAEEFRRAERYDTALSLLMLDVDEFKRYNDTFGHPAGDAVLKTVAQILRESVRDVDVAARYGGEEFVVILPQTGSQGACTIAERIRAAIAAAPWDNRAVTVSIGVSTQTPATSDPATLIARADAALYCSKAAGRNQVTFSDSDVAACVTQTSHAG